MLTREGKYNFESHYDKIFRGLDTLSSNTLSESKCKIVCNKFFTNMVDMLGRVWSTHMDERPSTFKFQFGVLWSQIVASLQKSGVLGGKSVF